MGNSSYVPLQLRAKPPSILKTPVYSNFAPNLFLFLKIPLQSNFDFNSIYEALHDTAIPSRFWNPTPTPLQLRLRNALSPALELSISGAYTHTYAKMR
jgi:hypothetical protein